jgi:hypothetical protein
MVYTEVMLGKRVDWTMMTTHNHSQINKQTIDIPLDVDWNMGLIYHAITNRLLQKGLAAPAKAPRSPHMDMGAQYTRWDDPNMERDALYMNREGTLENRTDSYREDHNPYAQTDVVDDTVTKEDFQDIND